MPMSIRLTRWLDFGFDRFEAGPRCSFDGFVELPDIFCRRQKERKKRNQIRNDNHQQFHVLELHKTYTEINTMQSSEEGII